MPIPTLITDISQTASSNYPQGTDSPSTLDDVQRAHASFIAMLRDGKGLTNPVQLASAATTDIGAQNSFFVEITGVNPINSFGANYNGPRFLRFTGILTMTHSAGSLNLPGAANLTTGAGDTAIVEPNITANGWNVVSYQQYSLAPGGVSPATATAIQKQTYTAFTTGGVSTAFTLTPSPAITANTAGTEFEVTFSVAAGLTPTLAVSGLAALPLKYRDYTGTLQAITATQVPVGWVSKVYTDGVNWIVLEVAAQIFPPVLVRQTVLSGPVDANGLPNFGGATGATTVTATGTLIATAANSFASNTYAAGGNVDRVGSITNPSWTGLSTNGAMYLYLDIGADGTCTTGSTTLVPVYQFGGTYGVASGQFTFNTQEMIGKVGNGAAAVQTYRVFVGEVTVAAGVVSAITWYSLMGRYVSATTATLPGANTFVTANHNIGLIPKTRRFVIVNITPEIGYTTGQELSQAYTGSSLALIPTADRLAIRVATSLSPAFGGVAYTGVNISGITAAFWSYRFEAERGW